MSAQYSIFDECFVDSFAGGGGASTGTENDRAVLLSILRYYLSDHDNDLCSDLTRIVSYLENLN